MRAQRPVLIWLYGLVLGLSVCAPGHSASLEDRLATARLELEIGVATEQRILTELERYRSSADASQDRISLYETYLDRVRQLTEEKIPGLQPIHVFIKRRLAPGIRTCNAVRDRLEDLSRRAGEGCVQAHEPVAVGDLGHRIPAVDQQGRRDAGLDVIRGNRVSYCTALREYYKSVFMPLQSASAVAG